MTIDLSGKRVLITGGLGAIAEAIVRQLLSLGASIDVTDLADETTGLATAIERWGEGAVRYARMDVTDPRMVAKVVQALAAQSPLDVVIGAAGGTPIQPFLVTPREEFDRVFAVNFTAQTYLAREVISAWRRLNVGGHLIFISSWVAQYPYPEIAAYTSAKAALEMFTRNLALDFSDHGIRVNCVAPGVVAAGSALKLYEEHEEYRRSIDRLIPLGQMSPASTIAESVAFLCSEFARDYQGVVLRPDRGLSIPNIR